MMTSLHGTARDPSHQLQCYSHTSQRLADNVKATVDMALPYSKWRLIVRYTLTSMPLFNVRPSRGVP
jgi:hypothetical protein